jgi:hypothetical protein
LSKTSSAYQDKLTSNVLLDIIYGQLYPARWGRNVNELTRILLNSVNHSAAISSMVKDLSRCGIWSAKNLMIIDIEHFLEIGGNNCAV